MHVPIESTKESTKASTKPINIGVLGAANIAKLFIAAVRPSKRVKIAAVASRDIDKGRAFAKALDVPVVHASYDELLADPTIDAVYNPLPNNLHAEWSIRAAQAGKHVLCEKPLCMSTREAIAIFEAAESHGVHIVEGYPYRCQPQTIKVAQLLKERVVGTPQFVQASFGFTLNDTSNIRYNPALGGGALMDAGSYPLSMVRLIAGERPTQVHAFARWAETGVERSLVASIEHPSGLLAQIACSFGTARNRRAFVVGDAGTLDDDVFQRHVRRDAAAHRGHARRRLGREARGDRHRGDARIPRRGGRLCRAGAGRLVGVAGRDAAGIQGHHAHAGGAGGKRALGARGGAGLKRAGLEAAARAARRGRRTRVSVCLSFRGAKRLRSRL